MEEITEQFDVLFEVPVQLDLVKSEDEEGKRCVKGFGSTEDEDQQGETVLKSGMDIEPLRDHGFVNYDHQRRIIGGVKVPMIIGVPTLVEMRDRGVWIEGELLKGDPMESEQLRLANEMWQLGISLQKAGSLRTLSYSIEGKVLARRGKKVAKSQASQVALTHKPVNPACTVEMFAKSMCCGRCQPGHPLYNPAHTCGSGNKHFEFQDGMPHLMAVLEKSLTTENSGPHGRPRTSPLMRENLDRGITTVLYGDRPCDHFDPLTGRFKDGVAGAYNHMTGCLGYSREDTLRLLKRIVNGASTNAELSALIQAAGFIRS
jgi:hypothetical protein